MYQTASALPSSYVDHSRNDNKRDQMQYLGNSTSFRDFSRREDAGLFSRAHSAPTQDAMAKRAKRDLGVSKNTFINWLQCKCDAPSWAVKRAQQKIQKIDQLAERIAGDERPKRNC